MTIRLLIALLLIPVSSKATDLVGGEQPKMLSPEEAIKTFTMAEGFEVNLWASEVDFPLHAPAAMTFDAHGRLWVSNVTTHPHAKPGVEPRDAIIILEDTDRSGSADKSTVFYDHLYLPMGFGLANNGKTVYAVSEPNLMRLDDNDGDGVADEARVELHGFGTEDNHHVISAFQWGPGGRMFFGQGLFLNTQVETPHGVVRAYEGNVFRWDPRDHRLENFARFGFSNPWGIIFDEWGQPLLADASPAMNYYLSHMSSRFDYPKTSNFRDTIASRGGYSFTPVGRRPSCGNELLLSEHFPEEVRGWYVTNQMKGWHGVRWYRLREEGSGLASDQPYGEEGELMSCSDMTFRPVAMQIGPDGALYVLDYYNPIVGHTTYNFRDPRRIQTHGRVWRITAKDRPLVWQPTIVGEPVATLLDLLKNPNQRVRYHARRELQERPTDEVLPALASWVAATSNEQELVEALWIAQGHNHIDSKLLKRLLSAEKSEARTAAVRVLRFWQNELPADEVISLLDAAVTDTSQRVRLEGLVACGFNADPTRSLPIAAKILDAEMDQGMSLAARETLSWLASRVDVTSPKVSSFLLPFTSDEELLSQNLTREIAEEYLNRSSLSAENHRAALMLMGDPLKEVIGRIEAGKNLDVLNRMLVAWNPAELKENSEAISKLASASPKNASLKAVHVIAGGDLDFEAEPVTALEAVKLLGRSRTPAAAFKEVAERARTGTGAVRRSAVDALHAFPDSDAEAIQLLNEISRESAVANNLQASFAALSVMQRIPKSRWPNTVAQRPVTKITISATPNFQFEPALFEVPAGSAVELTFFNPDNLFHNLVVCKPGTLESVGMAADAMAASPDALEKHYVPLDNEGVMYWTPQLVIGGARRHTLRFFAPENTADYPYACTFPGHWRVMNGVMRVVEK